MQSPVKKIYITQIFGANPASYAQFGLKGHNGIDFRAFLPNGNRCYAGGQSEVFAPHDGVILENTFDADGFGNYVKIESEIEGSVLAHFSSKCTLPVGTKVKQGQFIAYQGTTGNSTGIHLHWGYYKIPRDRTNGYNGYINQYGLYSDYKEEEQTESTTMTDEQKGRENGNKFFANIKGNINAKETPQDLAVWVQNDIDNVSNEINQCYKDKISLDDEKNKLENEVTTLTSQLEKKTADFEALEKVVSGKDKEISELKGLVNSQSTVGTGGELPNIVTNQSVTYQLDSITLDTDRQNRVGYYKKI